MKEEINKVYLTAQACLANLSNSGIEEAVLLQNRFQFDQMDPSKKMAQAAAVFQEARYLYINEAIRKTGIRNILDLGCGYSPRGIKMVKEGFHYVGADLPAVIDMVEPVQLSCVEKEEKGRMHYKAVDATNPGSVLAAADLLDGPVCIATEGILMYFSGQELLTVLESIKTVLRKHGGVLITPDYAAHAMMEQSFNQITGRLISKVAGFISVKVRNNFAGYAKDEENSFDWFKEDSDENPQLFFEKQGFTIEKTPILGPDTELKSLKRIEKEKADRIIEEYKKISGWVVRYTDDAPGNYGNTTGEKTFQVSCIREGKRAVFALSGRLDTLTAPDLLELFEAEMKKDPISEAVLDMKYLDYISSAGLRVLMIMKKKTAHKKVKGENMSELVKNIMAQTGFDEIL